MPFLFLVPKRGDVVPNELRLSQRLCPYRGALARLDMAGGTLWVTWLARATANGIELPAGTKRPPNSSWLDVRATGDSVRFETDPLGTFPLWLAETDEWLAVTAEVKALAAIDGFVVDFEPERWPADRKRPPDYAPYGNVRRVMPGAVLHVARDASWRTEGRVPLVYQPASMIEDAAEQIDALDRTLVKSAQVIASAGGDWAAFLSGGIDSSTATSLLAHDAPELRTYTLGTEHGDEYADAGALASHLGLRHTQVFATTEQAREHFDRAVRENETIDGLTGETLAQLAILAQAAATDGARRVVTGYGADLLFGSMLRHELYMKVTGVDDLQSLIERTMWSGEFAPFYAWSIGVEVHHLFWDPDVMNAAFRIPPDQSFDGTHEKVILRRAMVERGHLRPEHAFRKKQALTDGTQFNRVLSHALGLPDKHAYGGKNDAAVAVLRRALP